MANQEQVDRLRQGVKDWNNWREKHPYDTIALIGANLNGADLNDTDLNGTDLSGADLNDTDLSGALLMGANLSGALLSRANLSGALLMGAVLDGANLSNANLSGAHLSGAHLIGANLTYAHLTYAHLTYANLTYANLTYANLNDAELNGAILKGTMIGRTTFGGIDLRTIQGLETVIHGRPSIIGTDTILRSEGDIPEVFLRGAGLSDTFITYARSLAQHPTEYSTCFISYSSQDKAFVTRLYADLQSNNVRCWFAPEDLKIGDKFRPRIDESIRLYDKLLLVLSEHSIASNWVAYEAEKALDKEPQSKHTVLFPIRIDDTLLTCNTQWAQDIKHTRHVGDFTHWKDYDSYQKSLERLLRDLKAKSNR